jgi:(1->4)-alpha-D-glucan 1-alpha-D-glucosylmutase
MQKASKEAKVETSWVNPNAAYDEALQAYVARALADGAFVDDVRDFCATLDPYGAANGLAQTLLRLCCPGVADTYQGAELWNQSLVDPDNRRPVDYDRRRRELARIREGLGDPAALARALRDRYADGAVKLYVTHAALGARRAHRELFLRGDYEALAGSDHVVAFTRAFGAERLLCCTARLSLRRTRGERPWAVGDAWGEEKIALPYAGTYRDVLTGAVLRAKGRLRLADVFADLPVALLLRDPDEA